MKYKNTYNANIEIGPHRFLEPHGIIDLSEEDLKTPQIRSILQTKNWLQPIIQEVVTAFTTAEAERIVHGTQPETVNNNFSVNLNLKKEAPVQDSPEIQEAIDRAKLQQEEQKKFRGWNPMDDAFNSPEDEEEELANAYKHVNIDGRTEYGNSEHNTDLSPVSFSDGSFGTMRSLQETSAQIEKQREVKPPTTVSPKPKTKSTTNKSTKKKDA